MPTYTIKDPQSGKTITLQGDSPPTESELEQVFSQSGVRGQTEQPQAPTLNQNIQQNPVANLLLGNSLRTGQDISSGINANKTQGVRSERNMKAFEQAHKLEDAAAVTGDTAVKKRLLSQANDIYKQVSKSEQEVSQSFSRDVKQNPAWRGLKAGAEIGSVADEITHLPAQVKSIYKGGQALLHPFKTAGNIKDAAIAQADKLGNMLDLNKVVETAKDARSSIPATELPAYDKYLSTLTDQAKDSRFISTEKAANMLTRANAAYKASGELKDTARAAFEKILGDSIKGQLPDEVNKANTLFHYLYGAKGFAKKALSPFVLGPVAGAGILGKVLSGK